MTPEAALEVFLRLTADKRKGAALGLVRRSVRDRIPKIDTREGPGRLVLEVILSAASSAFQSKLKWSGKDDSVEALEWWCVSSFHEPWFDLLQLDPGPTRELFFRLLPYLSLDKEVLTLWKSTSTTSLGRTTATRLLGK